MNVILGFGEYHVNATKVRAKELARILLLDGMEAMKAAESEYAATLDPLAYFGAIGVTPRDDVAIVRVTEMHITRSHPYSPDGVAGMRLAVMATALNTFGNIEIAVGGSEEIAQAVLPTGADHAHK